jgi:hypothetical protein
MDRRHTFSGSLLFNIKLKHNLIESIFTLYTYICVITA